MSKRSFSEIEQAIKAAAEANEPAFDEQSWKKMEAMLDKEEDRKRPVAFWMWWMLPLILGGAVLSYFVFNKNGKKNPQEEIAAQKIKNVSNTQIRADKTSTTVALPEFSETEKAVQNNSVKLQEADKDPSISIFKPVAGFSKKKLPGNSSKEETFSSKRKQKNNIGGKMIATIEPASTTEDEENNDQTGNKNTNNDDKGLVNKSDKTEEIVVIKVDANKTSETEIEQIVDSVVSKLNSAKSPKNKIARLYIIAAIGAEANGTKLFSADKITARYGLGLGYQINKNISVQTGFYISNKKYAAAGSDYKTKPGTYWNIVDIKSIEANCRVYEIPIAVVYKFHTRKKLGLFAAAGLSSYIMKKENYEFYYERYGTYHQAYANYKGNKNLFSVLRLSAGIEKKVSEKLSFTVAPGIALPLTGVGEGEVKLYSTDISIGIRFMPFKKK